MSAFNKDAWILAALRHGHIAAERSGKVLRQRLYKDDTGATRIMREEVGIRVHRKTGRVYFTLTFMGLTKSVLVNRVIALAFLPNPLGLPQVNHLDGNKQNNAVSNLEWASASMNEKHAFATGLKSSRGSANANAKLNSQVVQAIRDSQESSSILAARYNVKEKTIKDVRERKTWSHI